MANLNWTNEIMPIKQSACVFIALFGALGYSMLFMLGYMIIGFILGFAVYMSCFAALSLVLNIILFMWLKKKGSAAFASL